MRSRPVQFPRCTITFLLHIRFHPNISSRQAENKETIKAQQERDAARRLQAQNAPQTDNPLPAVSLPKAPGPRIGIDESVTYLHPETNQLVGFTVQGLQRVGKDEMLYTIAYVDNEEVEVELNEQEMSDILGRRV